MVPVFQIGRLPNAHCAAVDSLKDANGLMVTWGRLKNTMVPVFQRRLKEAHGLMVNTHGNLGEIERGEWSSLPGGD